MVTITTSQAQLFPRGNARKTDTASMLRKLVVEPGGRTGVPKGFGGGWGVPFQFVGVRVRLTSRLSRAINWMEAQFPKQIKRVTYETHDNLSQLLIHDARRHYQRAQRANRRPGSSGQLESWLTDPKKYDKLIKATPHAMSVNFNVLSLYVRSETGFPYWKMAEYGYDKRTIKSGLFITSGGRFAKPWKGSDKRDPKVVDFGEGGRGVTFSISFEGYGFVAAAEEKFMANIKQDYRVNFMAELRQVRGSPWKLEEIVKFYGGGGYIDPAGKLRLVSNKRFTTTGGLGTGTLSTGF